MSAPREPGWWQTRPLIDESDLAENVGRVDHLAAADGEEERRYQRFEHSVDESPYEDDPYPDDPVTDPPLHRGHQRSWEEEQEARRRSYLYEEAAAAEEQLSHARGYDEPWPVVDEQAWQDERALQRAQPAELVEAHPDYRAVALPPRAPSWPAPDQEAPSLLKRGHATSGVLVRIGLLALAIVAVGVIGVMAMRGDFASLVGNLRGGTIASAPTPRLVTSNQVALANERIRLGVAIAPVAAGLSVVIVGLPAGSQINAGRPAGALGWRLFVQELESVEILPPRDFAGAVDVLVDLRKADETVVDRATVQLEWRPPAEPRLASSGDSTSSAGVDRQIPRAVTTERIGPSGTVLPREGTIPPPPMASSGSTAVVPQPAPPPAPAVTARAVEPAIRPSPTPGMRGGVVSAPGAAVEAEASGLIARADELVKQGDFASARLLLQRAAEQRHAGAALALGATYDPLMLKRSGAVGVAADTEKARQWYARAAEYGSDEASRRLDRLADGR